MPVTAPASGPTTPAQVGAAELFAAFLKVGLSGFGGVLPFIRRMLVDQRNWLTETQFTEVLSLAQFLPGPNVVNVAVIIGRRFAGVAGALAAACGLLLLPLAVALALATSLATVADVPAVRGATRGISAAASGLIVGVALKMARPIRGTPWQLVVAAVVFAAIGIFRLPLPWVLAAVFPLALAWAWRRRR